MSTDRNHSWMHSDELPWRQKLRLLLEGGVDRYLTVIDSLCARLKLWLCGARVGPGLRVRGSLHCKNYGLLTIGSNVAINSCGRNNFVAGGRKTALWVGPGAKLHLGDGVGISGASIIAQGSITIGQGTLIGGGCEIYDTNFHEIAASDRERRKGNIAIAAVVIGPRVFVGANTTILKGVQIGEGAVIGAGSVVAVSVPAFEVWAGNPLRFIRRL